MQLIMAPPAGLLFWLMSLVALLEAAQGTVTVHRSSDLCLALMNEETDLELACDVKAYSEVSG